MLLCSSKVNTGHYSYKDTLQISVQIYFPCLQVMDLRHRGIVFPEFIVIGKWVPCLWKCVVGQHHCLWWEMGRSLSFPHNLKKKKEIQLEPKSLWSWWLPRSIPSPRNNNTSVILWAFLCHCGARELPADRGKDPFWVHFPDASQMKGMIFLLGPLPLC